MQAAYAHSGPQPTPQSWWTAWSTDWWLWLLIGLSGALYLRGVRRLWRSAAVGAGVTQLQAGAFATGWVMLVIALLSPLDALGSALFCAHMVQHEVLMIVATPLLVAGHPLGPWIWSLPKSWRKPAADLCVESGLRAAVGWLTRPLVASIASVLALWIWHVPLLFNAALGNEGVHVLQHASFFVSSLLFWWALFPGRNARSASGAGVFYVFAAGVQSSVLGALLTFAQTPWYQAYVLTAEIWKLTPLEDLQLGGLVMWIPGGLIYLAITLGLVAAWMRDSKLEVISSGQADPTPE
jgi:putative membrane protein